MDASSEFTIIDGKLTILAAFGHGGELDKTQLKMLIGSEVIAERWNKPIEIEKFLPQGYQYCGQKSKSGIRSH